MNLKISAFLVLFLACAAAQAQNLSVTGTVVDSSDRKPLINANVLLTNARDSTRWHGMVTDNSGTFTFENVEAGRYRLKISYLGYVTTVKTVDVSTATRKLGAIPLTQSAIRMKQVEVEALLPPVEQKEDTVQYNARMFKTNPDASAEDLVGKMPGVTVDKSGTVTHQGQTVQKVLVDGKEFFGEDPTIAMRNVPAEMIDKIQVYDQLSDQAQLTGFDDGQSQKTMNLITRITRRNGYFGKATAGYGDEERYQAALSFNWFDNDQRVTLLGISNNINQQNFSFQDILGVAGIGGNIPQRFSGAIQAGIRAIGGMGGGGGRGGGVIGMMGGGGLADFFVGQQNGINQTHSIGTNYSDTWAENLTASGSYFFNMSNNRSDKLLQREYFLSGDTSQFYDERNNGSSENQNHRFSMRVEYSPDTLNTIIFRPRVSLQANNSSSTLLGINTFGGLPLSSSLTANDADVTGNTLSGNLVFRHRFLERGRSLSISLNGSSNDRDGTSFLRSRNEFGTGSSAVIDSLDQSAISVTTGYSMSSNISYTEPISTTGLLQASYSASYSKNSNDKRTYDFNTLTSDYDTQNDALSNVLTSGYLTHRTGLGYRFRDGDINANAEATYQIATLSGTQTFPTSVDVSRKFYSVLPSAEFRWRLSATDNVNLRYRTSTNPPSISQLQDVVDNSNPLQLRTGNASLQQDYSHTLMARYTHSTADRSQTFFGFLYGGITDNYIGNTTILAEKDTILPGGIALARGTQLTYPVNLAGYRTARGLVTYSIPAYLFSGTLNISGGLNYTRTPGLINGISNIASTYGILPAVVVSSNVSENLDFTLSYLGGVNYTRNTAGASLDNDYYSHSAGARLTWNFWEGFVFRSDVTHQYYSGLTTGYNQDVVLWNLSLGKKFFSDQSAELAIGVFDVLNRNASTFRTVTESYIEDQRPNVLQRYFQVTFSYNLRNFTGAPPGREGPGRDGQPGFDRPPRDHDH